MSDDPEKRPVPNLGGVRPGETLGGDRQPRRDAMTWRPAEPNSGREPPKFGSESPMAPPEPRTRTAPPAGGIPPAANPTLAPKWQPAHLNPPGPVHPPMQHRSPPQGPAYPQPGAGPYAAPRTAPPPMQPTAPRTAPPHSQPVSQPQRAAGPPPPDFRGPKSIYRPSDIQEPPARSVVGRAVRYTLLFLLAIILVGAGAIVFLPPTELIRDHVVAEVKAKTGRVLTVGSARLTLVPSLGVNLKNVTLSAPLSMPGEPLLTARGVEVSVALLPLITREVQVERLVLVEPVINLRVDQSGRRSWDFAEAEFLRQPSPIRHAQAAPPRGQEFRKLPTELQDFAKNASTPPKPAGKLGISALSLGDVRISDGILRYGDQRTAARYEVTSVNMRMALKDLGGPLSVKGDLLYQREKLNVDVNIFALRELIEERATRLTARVIGPAFTASYEGEIAGGGAAMDGRMAVKAASASGLARLVQLPLPGLEALGGLGVEGQLKTGPGSVAFSNATFILGDFTANGALSVDIQGGRPQIKTTLKIATLDLDRLAAMKDGFSGAPGPARPAVAAPPPVSPAPAGPSAPAQSIEDLLKRTESEAPQPSGGTAVRGFTKRDGWSQEPIDFAALRMADVDGRFTIGDLVWQQIKVSQTQLALELKGGILKVNIQDAVLYGGRGRGLVNFDARQAEGILGLNISADGVAAATLLKDATGVDVLEGRGRVLVAVTGKGASERDFVGTLAGKAELTMADGAIIGWDANDLLAQMSQLKLPSFDKRAGARTPYSQLAATFQIANGVGRTQDIRFVSPALQAMGTGVVNLVDRNLNLLMKPKVATGNLANVDVPLRIAGNFDAISVVPEVKGSETLKQIGRQVREADVDNAVRGVLGDGPEAQEKAAKAKELLRRFLRP